MISTKGRYALRVMLDIADHESGGPVPLISVAERQGISKKYLEILVRELVSAKFLVGVSGKGGGYRLTRRPEEYTVGEILERMEGTLAPVACLKPDTEPCPRAENCRTLPLWTEFDELVRGFFGSKKLSDL